MKATVQPRLDAILLRRGIHPVAPVVVTATRDSKGSARWTTSVFEDVWKRRDIQLLLAVAQEIIGLGL